MDPDLEQVLQMASRQGRELQKYIEGRRQVVGCIPYRLVNCDLCSSPLHKCNELEVLLVSSQKGQAMMFPKGGWELDETLEQAAQRESLEEAGVKGKIQEILGTWSFKSKSQEMFHDGYMLPLLVEKQLEHWPEKHIRQRRWVKVSEVKELCPYLWMKEALEKLEQRLCNLDPSALSMNQNQNQTRVCTSSDHNVSKRRMCFSVDSAYTRVRKHRTLSSEALRLEVFVQPVQNAVGVREM